MPKKERRKLRRAVLLVVLACLIFGCCAKAETLKIGLIRRFKDAKSVIASSTGSFQVSDKSGAVIIRANAGDKVTFQVSESKLLLLGVSGENTTAEPPFCVTCAPNDLLILYSNRNDKGCRYRGKISVSKNKTGITLINEVDIEDYLLGVIPCEMPDEYHPEALKAQAIAARTYAWANTGVFTLRHVRLPDLWRG